MLVAELTAPREFRLAERTIEEPGPGEVRVRVRAVGVCGSDLHSYGEGAIGDTPCVYPMVLGHEPAGEVVKLGAGVTGWAVGDRAALEPALYCYHCEFCRGGRHNICANIRFLSTPGHAGFFREFVILPMSNLLAIPPRLSFAEATLAEPLAIGLHSMQFASVGIGETVAVFGAGPIGLVTIACLRLAGAGRIWAVEPAAHRRAMAVKMGAAVALDPRRVRRGAGDSSTTRPAAASIAPSIAPPSRTRSTTPSAPCATAGAWCSPAFIPRRWCRSRFRRCGARNWPFSTSAARTTNRTPPSTCCSRTRPGSRP
jgi:threonine dehydrogenase-like Zn-dependent dehydrogenase